MLSGIIKAIVYDTNADSLSSMFVETFNLPKYCNDIAVLQLEQKVKFNYHTVKGFY